MTRAPLTEEQGQQLPALARRVLEAYFAGDRGGSTGSTMEDPADWLCAPLACFVTLKLEGRLRGCVGTLRPVRPLAEDLDRNTLAAAFDDCRFSPLRAQELAGVRIEVSILSVLEPMEANSESELLGQLRCGEDGLCIEHRGRRGTFLPQVWNSLPEPHKFVEQLKLKAGLAPDLWAPDLRFWRYTVASWQEASV